MAEFIIGFMFVMFMILTDLRLRKNNILLRELIEHTKEIKHRTYK